MPAHVFPPFRCCRQDFAAIGTVSVAFVVFLRKPPPYTFPSPTFFSLSLSLSLCFWIKDSSRVGQQHVFARECKQELDIKGLVTLFSDQSFRRKKTPRHLRLLPTQKPRPHALSLLSLFLEEKNISSTFTSCYERSAAFLPSLSLARARAHHFSTLPFRAAASSSSSV